MSNDGVNGAGTVYEIVRNGHGFTGPYPLSDESPKVNGHCGSSLVSYNANNDPLAYADIADGCPNATFELADDGVVEVHLGSSSGLGSGIDHYTSIIPQAGAEFGTSLAAADVGNDHGVGGDDLVVGVPLFDGGSDHTDEGTVWVIYETSDGTVYQQVRQGLGGTLGVAEGGDVFGAAVATGNFDGDGYADIAIGVPGESLGTTRGAGGVNVLYGSSAGITSAGNQFWSQSSTGIVGSAEAEDFFGDALAGRVR